MTTPLIFKTYICQFWDKGIWHTIEVELAAKHVDEWLEEFPNDVLTLKEN